jgi:hypothetical protein
MIMTISRQSHAMRQRNKYLCQQRRCQDHIIEQGKSTAQAIVPIIKWMTNRRRQTRPSSLPIIAATSSSGITPHHRFDQHQRR